MNERIKQDITMFLVVLVACLLFVGAVETFTGVLSQTRERNASNQQVISSLSDIIKNNEGLPKNPPVSQPLELT